VTELTFDLAAERVSELLGRREIELVDVREVYEREAGHIVGSRHVPLRDLRDYVPQKPVVFQCRVGARSALAAQAFRRAGYQAHNLRGGILEWRERGLPVEGYVADH
jgi:hydroxyacylglutathione hydrolase/adenylyltransferase/sulfurtransferase